MGRDNSSLLVSASDRGGIFGEEEQWQMGQEFEACRCSKIIGSGRTDADFIWVGFCLVSPATQYC